jgi:membrane-bound lytic murein transglycosylase B
MRNQRSCMYITSCLRTLVRFHGRPRVGAVSGRGILRHLCIPRRRVVARGRALMNWARVPALATSLVLLSAGNSAVAATSAANPHEDPAVQAFIAEMVKRHDLDRSELDELFREADFTQKVLDAFKRPAESKAWHQYRKIFLTKSRIEGGAAFWREHAETLSRAEKTYGVPAELVVAIIGVETFYGKHKGRIRVLDALTTLAFRYPRRAKFFRGELEAFLLLRHEESLPPKTLMGSYAGAMGFGQFIPTSYRAYAVDFDGDGRRDLLSNLSDAIGSVANYLHRHRWKAGQPVTHQVRGVSAQDARLAKRSLQPKLSVKALARDGIEAVSGKLPDGKVAMFTLADETGPTYWLGYQNFYAVSRYNPSKLYAMAVYQLSQEIKANYVQ